MANREHGHYIPCFKGIHLRNQWAPHDGIPGYEQNADDDLSASGIAPIPTAVEVFEPVIKIRRIQLRIKLGEVITGGLENPSLDSLEGLFQQSARLYDPSGILLPFPTPDVPSS